MAVPLDAAGQRQLDEGDLQGARGQACGPRQLVDVDRRRAERGQQAGAVLGADLGHRLQGPRLLGAAGASTGLDIAEWRLAQHRAGAWR